MKKFAIAVLIVAMMAAGIAYRVASGERWIPLPGPKATTPETLAAIAPARGLGLDPADLDPTVRPQDNLYLHVNGSWLARTRIPVDRSNYGAFVELAEQAEENLKRIILDLASAQPNPPQHPGAGNRESGSTPADPDLNATRIRDIYASFMDTDTIAAQGLAPVTALLASIDAIATVSDLASFFGHAQHTAVKVPLHLWVNQDARDTGQYAVYFAQGGLGLPDRDYYFKDEPRFAQIREAYQAHIQHLLELAGTAQAAQMGAQVLALERRIAQAHWSRVANRDRDALYNKLGLADAQDLMPGFDWPAFLQAADLAGLDTLIIRQPDYAKVLASLMQDVPLAHWRAYLRWQSLSMAAPFLTQPFVDADFEFFGRHLRGIDQNRPRWKRGVEVVEDMMGDALGRIYVQRYFKPEAKARIEALVENLRRAFSQAINELDWMSAQTREEAQAKLARFSTKLGYPKHWKSYQGLVVQPDTLMANVMASRAYEYQRHLGKLGQPVDREEWFLTPQTVNAYYNPSMNEIVFPAAILQPPFFDLTADDATNYGAIGAVIGHEFSHGFDDQGRKSDGDGNLRDWWSEADVMEFNRRAQQLVSQYSAFSPLEGLSINGELTLGENIADLAGLSMAYRAYQLSVTQTPAPVIEGYTGQQRFFMGWAQVWRRKYREDELRLRLLTGPHSPSEYRVLGVVANMPAFYEAFNVGEQDRSYLAPDERVKIW